MVFGRLFQVLMDVVVGIAVYFAIAAFVPDFSINIRMILLWLSPLFLRSLWKSNLSGNRAIAELKIGMDEPPCLLKYRSILWKKDYKNI